MDKHLSYFAQFDLANEVDHLHTFTIKSNVA